MHERIAILVITQRPIYTVWNRVQNEYFVVRRVLKLERAGEAQLKRHVEPYRRTRSTKVVNGHSAGPHEVKNTNQPADAFFPDFENAMGFLT